MQRLFTVFLLLFALFPQVTQALLPNVDDVVEKINIERTTRGLQALSKDSRLENAALAKARDIKGKEALIHTASFPWSFLISADYVYDYAGENLALNVLTSEELMEGWMNSPLHRENILNPSFRDVGVAIVSGEYKGEASDYIVAYFGKPKSNLVTSSNLNAVANKEAQNSLQINLIRELIALLTQYLSLLTP
jgi:hypothetical protein